MKKLLPAVIGAAMVVCFAGCSKNHPGEQRAVPSASTEEATEEAIPDRYTQEGTQIVIDCSVIAPEDVSLTKCEAQPVTYDQDTAKNILIGDQTISQSQEYGENTTQYELSNGLFLSIDDETLLYVNTDLERYIMRSIRFSKGTDDNTTAYTQENLSFASPEDTTENLCTLLDDLGLQSDQMQMTMHVLDKDTLSDQYEWIQEDGVAEEDALPATMQFTEKEEGYYITCRQMLQNVPVFGGSPITRDCDENSEITAYYTADGLQIFDCGFLYTFQESDTSLELLPFSDIADNVVNYYDKLLLDETYELDMATLYQYVKSDKEGGYSVTPIWIFTGTNTYTDENGQKQTGFEQIEMNAISGEVFPVG